jgi:uncharacterized membrane protein YeiH
MGGLLAAWAEWIGVAVFALTGALVAARKGMDPFGFAMLATVTGIGGGTMRDVLLGLPVFWVREPVDLVICIGVGVATYLFGSRSRGLAGAVRRNKVLVWADAVGLSIFAVTGTAKALAAGAHPLTAVVLGTLTASFGGMIRDILAGDVPLVLHREIYVTAAATGGAVFVAVAAVGIPLGVAGAFGMIAAFSLRALAIAYDWSLPPFRGWPDETAPPNA